MITTPGRIPEGIASIDICRSPAGRLPGETTGSRVCRQLRIPRSRSRRNMVSLSRIPMYPYALKRTRDAGLKMAEGRCNPRLVGCHGLRKRRAIEDYAPERRCVEVLPVPGRVLVFQAQNLPPARANPTGQRSAGPPEWGAGPRRESGAALPRCRKAPENRSPFAHRNRTGGRRRASRRRGADPWIRD